MRKDWFVKKWHNVPRWYFFTEDFIKQWREKEQKLHQLPTAGESIACNQMQGKSCKRTHVPLWVQKRTWHRDDPKAKPLAYTQRCGFLIGPDGGWSQSSFIAEHSDERSKHGRVVIYPTWNKISRLKLKSSTLIPPFHYWLKLHLVDLKPDTGSQAMLYKSGHYNQRAVIN